MKTIFSFLTIILALNTINAQPLVKEYETKECLVHDANQLTEQFSVFIHNNGIDLPYIPGVEVATTYKLIYCDPENKRIVLPIWQELYPEQRTLFARWKGDEAQQFYISMFNWYFIAHEMGHFTMFTNPDLHISAYETEHRANIIAISFFRSTGENRKRLLQIENSLQEVLKGLPAIDLENMTEEDYFNANYQKLGNNPDAYAYFQFKFILDIMKDNGQYKIADVIK